MSARRDHYTTGSLQGIHLNSGTPEKRDKSMLTIELQHRISFLDASQLDERVVARKAERDDGVPGSDD